jgi:predicted O-methyltransferase YrrM
MDKIYSQDWFSNNLPYWHAILEKNFKGQPGLNFLEIGSFEGRSACWLMEHVLTHESARLSCVDPFMNSVRLPGGEEWPLRKVFDHNTEAWHSRMRVMPEFSHSALPRMLAAQEQFDFIYIDGSHAAADVMFDAVNCFHLVKPGGILLFDDYMGGNLTTPDDPKPAIDAFLFAYRSRLKVMAMSYQVWLQKLA